MFSIRQVVASSQIVNLTGSPFNVYEECTGEIYTLIPSTEALPTPKFTKGMRPTTYYVVREETIKKLQEAHRTLDDIAYICDRGAGFAKIPICTLASAASPRIIIRLKRYGLHLEGNESQDNSELYVKLT